MGTSASARWIWDDCTISGGANDVVCTGFRTLHSHSERFGLTLHTHNDKLAIYLPQADESLYNSLVDGSASDHAVDTAGSDLVGDLIRFGFRVRFDGVERVLGAPYSLNPGFMVSHVKKVVDKTIRLADSIKLMREARAESMLLRYCTFSRIMATVT